MRLMLRALCRVSVQDGLAKSKELLSERTAPYTVSCNDAVLAANQDVEQKADVFDHPRHNLVVDWDILAYPRLEAQLDGPE